MDLIFKGKTYQFILFANISLTVTDRTHDDIVIKYEDMYFPSSSTILNVVPHDLGIYFQVKRLHVVFGNGKSQRKMLNYDFCRRCENYIRYL